MAYEYTIKISKHLYEDIPLWKVTTSAIKVLNRVRKYAPYETGRLQDSISIRTEDLDNQKLTIFIDTNYFKDWDSDVPYYKYLNEDSDKHYRRGAFQGQQTKGWWGRLCDAFTELWKVRADALENYQRKENDTNASASEHRKLVETDQVRKLGTQELTKEQIQNEVANVTQEEVTEYNATHKATRKLTYERKGYIEPTNTPIIRMSVQDLQWLSAENMQYLLNKELGIDLQIKLATGKTEFYRIKRELLQVSKDYGEITIGGIPVRTIIRELIRKLYNNENMNAR